MTIGQISSQIHCTRFEPLWSATSGLRRPSPLAWVVGHTATFAVNAALVTGQWHQLHCTHPLHSTRLNRPQVPVYDYSVQLDRDSNPT